MSDFDLHDITYDQIDYWCPMEAVQMVIDRNYLRKEPVLPEPQEGIVTGFFEWFLFLKDGRYQIISGLELFTMMTLFAAEQQIHDEEKLLSMPKLSIECVYDYINVVRDIKPLPQFGSN